MKLNLIRGILLTIVLYYDVSSSQQLLISEKDLQELFSNLTRPRLMSLTDLLSEKDRQAFKDFGYRFSLSGDFNQDKIRDIAIVGMFTNKEDVTDQTFVAIITKRSEKWAVDYFLRPKTTVIALTFAHHPDATKANKGYQSVIAQFTPAPSDDYGLIYWDGNSYKIKSGFDLMAESVK